MLDSMTDGVSSLIGLSGVQVPARARFLGSFFAVTTYASLTTGMVLGQVGAMTSAGPLVPFMVGSWLGYTAGCRQVWCGGRRDALHVASKYPKLLSHTLSVEFSMDAPSEGAMLAKWMTAETGRMSWAILAAQSCRQQVAELEEQALQRLVEEYADS